MNTCKGCVAASQQGDRFCYLCGSPTTELTMACVRCSEPVGATDMYCYHCGSPQAFPDCEACGYVFLTNDRFCPNDGTPRALPSQPTSPPPPNKAAWTDFTAALEAAPVPKSPPQRLVALKKWQQGYGRVVNYFRRLQFRLRFPLRPASRPYKILVIGQTGSGKSTFVNMLCSYFREGTATAPKVIIWNKHIPVTEKDAKLESEFGYMSKAMNLIKGNTSQSQTQHPVCYTFDDARTGCWYHVVDTPGLADTRGVDQDEKNITSIMDYVSTMDYLDCIVIVGNGSVPRFDACLKTVLQRFRGNLPNSVRKSVAVVLTNCTKLTANFDINLIEQELLGPNVNLNRDKNVFHMNNMAFSSDPKSWTAEDIEDEVQPSWNKSMKAIKHFLDHVHECTSTSTDDFKTMKDSREMIKSKLADVLNHLRNADKLRQKISEFDRVIEEAKMNAERYHNFIQTEEITVKVQVPTNHYNTSCAYCSVTCHKNCNLDEIKSDKSGFRSCECFGEPALSRFLNDVMSLWSHIPKCQVCGCGTENHYHDTKMWTEEPRTIEKVCEDIKRQFDMQVTVKEGALSGKARMKGDIEMLVSASKAAMNEIHRLVKKLKEVCDGVNIALELGTSIDFWERDLKTAEHPDTRAELQKHINEMKEMIQVMGVAQSSEPVSSQSPEETVPTRARKSSIGAQIMRKLSATLSTSKPEITAPPAAQPRSALPPMSGFKFYSAPQKDNVAEASALFNKATGRKGTAKEENLPDVPTYDFEGQTTERRVDDGIAKLVALIEENGQVDKAEGGKKTATFGVVFDKFGPERDMLVGILMCAKNKGKVKYVGDMLFKGVHDNVKITIV